MQKEQTLRLFLRVDTKAKITMTLKNPLNSMLPFKIFSNYAPNIALCWNYDDKKQVFRCREVRSLIVFVSAGQQQEQEQKTVTGNSKIFSAIFISALVGYAVRMLQDLLRRKKPASPDITTILQPQPVQ